MCYVMVAVAVVCVLEVVAGTLHKETSLLFQTQNIQSLLALVVLGEFLAQITITQAMEVMEA